MKLIYSNQNLAQVGLMQSYLAEHNIRSELRNQHASSVMGEVSFFSVWPECWVADHDFAAAKQLLDELDAAPTPTSEWQCSNCGEVSPANFSVCWSCESPVDPSQLGAQFKA